MNEKKIKEMFIKNEQLQIYNWQDLFKSQMFRNNEVPKLVPIWTGPGSTLRATPKQAH